MPIVPYQQNKTISGEAPSARAPIPSASGAGIVGAGISSLGKGIGDVADVFAKIEKQKEGNKLIEIGSKINNDILAFETKFKQENKGINASESQFRAGEFTKTLYDKYATKDSSEYSKNAIKKHISAHDYSLKSKLASYEAGESKNYATDVRKLDFESSLKLAQSGDVSTAIINYEKTLKSQKDNGSISATDYDIETIEAKSAMYSAHITELLNTDPKSAKDVFNVVKQDLTAKTQAALEAKIKPAVIRRTGVDIGTDIFKNDKSGSLETMIDNVKGKKLDAETEHIAIAEIKDMWNVKKTDEAKIKTDAIKEVNDILVPIALKRNGINKQGDLTDAQWSKLINDNAEYAAKLQDSMRKDADYIIRQNKADKREDMKAVREAMFYKKIEQSENESLILLNPDFATYDLASALALSKIDNTQYLKLKKLQEAAEPLKNDAVKSALQKVNQGSALAGALNVDDKNAEAIWKQKYGDLVKAYAYNNWGKPDFEKGLSEFLENQVFNKMVSSWFKKDTTDRDLKFQKAKEIAGELPEKVKGKQVKPATEGKKVIERRKTASGKTLIKYSDGTIVEEK